MGFGGKSYPPAEIGFGAHPEPEKNNQNENRCGYCVKGEECECKQKECACQQEKSEK